MRAASTALAASLLLAAAAAHVPGARAAGPAADASGGEAADGRAVMERVDARARGADEMLRATWVLRDRRGGERERVIRAWWKDERGGADGFHSKRLLVFESPARIAGTAFLVHARVDPEAEDLRWVYLPALRKVRRIAGRDQDKRFAGSDFTYEDLSARGVDEDRHRLLRTETRDGVLHYVVESVPRGASAYTRRVQWVDGTRWLVTHAEFYGPGDRLEKTLDATWRQVDGIWFWDQLRMQDRIREHETRVQVDEVAHDQGLAEDFFHESTLRQGGR